MAYNETILEAPVTPAPLFAYRAIKGIFFASPDSSPEHANKENIEPLHAKSPMKPPSLALDQQLTPSHKRKWDTAGPMVSPTKGILRTPGLATPRAKLLKDVNVKFKSVSPEVLEKNNKPGDAIKGDGAHTVPADGRPRHRGVKSMNDVPVAASGKTTNTRVSPQQKQPEPVLAPAPAPSAPAPNDVLLSSQAIEAYMHQTEKEMKRLVRYAQKMREYARKTDAENEELKTMIRQLQKENKSLKEGGALDVRARQSDVSANADADAGQGLLREDVGRLEATVARHVKNVRRPLSGSSEVESRKTSSPSINWADSQKTCPSSITIVKPSSTTQASTTPANHRTSSSAKRIHSQREHDKAEPSFGNARTGSGTSIAADTEHLPPSTDTGTIAGLAATVARSTRLPPDRLAAARERLRRRVEARKASAGAESEVENQSEVQRVDTANNVSRVVDQHQHRRHDRNASVSKVQSWDQSQVDWLNV